MPADPTPAAAAHGLEREPLSGPGRGAVRLHLRYRRLIGGDKRERRRAGDAGEEGDFVPCPAEGSAEEGRLLRAKQRKAKEEYGAKIDELEQAIENNRIELERLTSNKDADGNDIYLVARERQYLKAQLEERLEEDAEARFELRGEDVSYEVGLGCSMLLAELPGRPRVVWSVEEGCSACVRRAFQSSHSVLYEGGRMHSQVDVSRLAYEKSLGSRGQGPGEFEAISGVAVDEEHVYTADAAKHCIHVHDWRSGHLVRSWGGEGSGDAEFNQPHGLQQQSRAGVYKGWRLRAVYWGRE